MQPFSIKMTAVVYPSPDLNCKKLCQLFTQTKLHHTATVNTLQNPLKIVLLSILLRNTTYYVLIHDVDLYFQ